MRAALSGIIIPATTPFGEDGELLFDGISANLDTWSRTDVCGYMFLGSNGESRSLTDAESLAVVRTASEGRAGKTLIVGVGRDSTFATLRFMESALDAAPNIDYVSVLTPSYFSAQMSDAALEAHYVAVADESPRPVIIYAAPRFANGVKPSAALVARLAQHPNIAAIKDTTQEYIKDYLSAVQGTPGFTVLAGSIGDLWQCLEGGGAGGVISAANYVPELCVAVTTEFQAGRRQRALTHLDSLREIVQATSGRHSVAGVKACMNLCGYVGGIPRPPVFPVPEGDLPEMRRELARHGVIGPGASRTGGS